MQISYFLLNLNGRLVNLVFYMRIRNNMMALLLINIGLMYNWDGVIMIHMIFRDMHELNFWTILPIVFRFILRLLVALLLLIWPIICILLLGTISLGSGPCCCKLSTRLWKLILPSMCWGNVLEKVYSCILPNQQNLTWILKITPTCLWIRPFGSLMIPTSTESQFTKHSRVT